MPAYLIEGVLSRDGFGIAYRGRNRVSRAPAVVKVLMAGEHGTPEELAVVAAQAEIARRLAHDNLVHVLEVWTQPAEPAGRPLDAVWIAYQHVDGFPIMAESREGGMAWARATEAIRDVADALAAAHELGLHHLAIRPDALSRDIEGRVRLADLGIGRPRARDPFAAPEQLDGAPVDGRTDVWRLGATLYTLLAGIPPFTGANAEGLSAAIHAANLPKLSDRAPEAPSTVERVLRSCCVANPKRRYANIAELRDDLGRVMAGQAPRSRRTTRIWLPFSG